MKTVNSKSRILLIELMDKKIKQNIENLDMCNLIINQKRKNLLY